MKDMTEKTSANGRNALPSGPPVDREFSALAEHTPTAGSPAGRTVRERKGSSSRALDGVSAWMEKRPWLVLGTAAAVGMVAGLFLKRNRAP